MTTKDLRDIAAYLGCAISYLPLLPHESPATLTPQSLLDLEYAVHSSEFAGIVLHLRPLSSLTDAELAGCMDVLQPEQHAFLRNRGEIYLGEYRLNVVTGEVYDRNHLSMPCAGLYAYLQSIAVYVPGTINEKYVQLTEK